MVIHLVALSEILKHDCGHMVRQLFTSSRKAEEWGLQCWSFQESLAAQMDGVVPKTAKTQKRQVRYCLIICP